MNMQVKVKNHAFLPLVGLKAGFSVVALTAAVIFV